MKNHAYTIVIIDSSGATTKRIKCSRERGLLMAGAGVLCALVLVGFAAHAMSLQGLVQENRLVARQNHELKRLLHQTQPLRKQIRSLGTNVEAHSRFMWALSGLDAGTTQVGIGPLDLPSPSISPRTDHLLMAAENVTMEGLLIAFQRVRSRSLELQENLGDVVEYFRDAQRLLENTPSRRPVQGRNFTSSFGKRRDPINGRWLMHKGVDIGGGMGTKIISPADGVVIWTAHRGAYGRTIVIDHGYGLQTHYAHLSRYLVSRGERVNRGDVIAEMGSSGKSTGPHLHYEVRRHGHPLNPTSFILD